MYAAVWSYVPIPKFEDFFFLDSLDKDVLRTDRDLEIYRNKDGTKLLQLEDILRTYVMYNFDLGE